MQDKGQNCFLTLKSCRREIDMPVFDFSNTTEEKKACECTYTTFQSNENTASAKYPILVLDNTAKQWKYHSCGVFTNQIKRTAFEFTQEDGTVCADILRVDARFVNLLRWLGETTLMSGCLERTHRMDMPCIRSVKLHLAVEKSFPRKMAFYSL